ncbi:methenyltetrahydromethanopterin cyclohydrolase [Halonotius aquaticus]|uniref:Methenyltetrahydromethanopterin cyclohydrolase n=1 Tax=Halonotius aquaticus TaxID=2216978 RepID=A0A3A6PNZ6_9EURY|nr:methenyltetrahydromethanopterin cyclohydrolase [Halonotius aquaticus]RJX42162.1 methenyltetrahydromethanopterin cyclohydrolase [Halonotius aquaticus]
MESINRSAIELIDEALDFADQLGIAVTELDCGATILDFGVGVDGGVEAGLMLADIQTAGLATVYTQMDRIADAPIPYVELTTDHPPIALLCAQKAGWELDLGDFDGLGSGPARALVGEETDFERVGYYDEFDFAVLAIESVELPDDEIATYIAETAGVDPGSLFLPTYATGSTAGSVSMAARAAELAVFRLSELGYPPTEILTATGRAPVAPVSYNESVAMARTNDALAYGGEVYLQVREESTVFDKVPSSAREEYGVPFEEIFEEAGWDFYELPESVFAPAKVTIDVVDGDTYVVGETNEELLAESFGLQ